MIPEQCDFCHEDPTTFILLTGVFATAEREPDDTGIVTWGACDACAGLIRANHWTALMGRAAAIMQRRGQTVSPNERIAMSEFYRYLRTSVVGDLRPIPAAG